MEEQIADNQQDNKSKKHRPWWHRIAKWLTLTIIGVSLIIIAVISVAVWMLTPEKLTHLVEKYSTEYLDADVTVGKVELTFWNTFPKLWLRADELTIVSHSLKNVPKHVRDSLPADADTLLTLHRFSGGVNLMALMYGNIELYDVALDRPHINIVQINDTLTNYMIVPASENTDTTTSPLPDISINKFVISDTALAGYISLSDSMDLTVKLATTELDGCERPLYSVDITGVGAGRLASGLVLPDMPFGINGEIGWEQSRPHSLSLNDFIVSANGVALKFNANMDFKESVLINSLTIDGNGINFRNIIDMIPEKQRDAISNINSDIEVDLSLKLLEPYSLSDSKIPSVELNLTIPKGFFKYERISINKITADIGATIDGNNLDESRLEIRKLKVDGRSLDFSFNATVERPITDPLIKARFNGSLNFSTLPQTLWQRLKFCATGKLSGNTSLRFHKSDLTPKRFHKLQADGSLTLASFSINTQDSSLTAMTHNTIMEFGTNAKVVIADTMRTDSLLKVSLSIDTLNFTGQGILLAIGNAKAVVAARNTLESVDTTRINPIGLAIRASRIKLHTDSDSVNMILRDAAVKATITRYNTSTKAPLLSLDVRARRARYNNPISRLSLTEAFINARMHPTMRHRTHIDSARREMIKRRIRMADSIRASKGTHNIDFELDRSMTSWLRRWKAEGTVKAKRARLLTPYFPVRNRLQNLDMIFNTDSIVIRNTKYRMGHSDFLINGSISNIARALTSRRGSPLKIDFDIKSDTININEIYNAAMAGSAFAIKNTKDANNASSAESDSALQLSIDSGLNNYDKAAFVVPANIDANLSVHANEVLYADIWFQKFSGKVAVHDGAIHLDRLAGFTPIGSLNLTALYSAPTYKNVTFAAGALINNLRLKEFLRLIPEIDTVLPLLREVDGIVTADVAMTSDIDSLMNIKFNTFNLILKLSGDSLVLIDNETFRTMAKWLMFKHKNRNIINSMKVELMIKDTKLSVFPFVFDFDRYRLGVSGYNTLDMDLDYHIAVLKSPLPFKFGINVKGKPDNMKIRLGKANFNENKVAYSRQLTDTLRLNLIREIRNVFKFGGRNGKRAQLHLNNKQYNNHDFQVSDTLTHADSLLLIQNGVLTKSSEQRLTTH